MVAATATDRSAAVDAVELNDAQRAAVTHRGAALLVEAGPGSGKTRVLVERVAALAAAGVDPAQILAITFTNRAALEMRRRIGQRIGFDTARRMWVCTFHSACARMLRVDGPVVGVPAGFDIADADATLRLCRQAITATGCDPVTYPARRARMEIAAAKQAGFTAEMYTDAAAEPDARFDMGRTADVFDNYQRRLDTAGAVDFEDLLLDVDTLLTDHPDVLGRWQRRFGHVLVDEYQDTNMLQNRIVLALAGGGDLTVVGDSDQAIYGFRGADLSNLAALHDRAGLAVVALEDNYRSSGVIVAAANALIAANVRPRPKRLRSVRGEGEPIVVYAAADEHDEAAWVASDIAARVSAGTPAGSIAVMYRTNAQSRALERAVAAAGVGCRVRGGVPFYERREVADVVAHLRAAADPDNNAACARAVNAPARGVGPKAAAALAAYAAEAGCSLLDAMDGPAGRGLWPDAAAGVGAYLDIRRSISAATVDGAAAAAETAATVSGLRDRITAEGTYDTPERLANLDELVAAARNHDTVDEFLADIDAHRRRPAAAPGAAVELLTMHSSKGLEYRVVYLTGFEEGLLPHNLHTDTVDDLAAERRLAYVALTRAADVAVCTFAARRALLPDTAGAASRFVDELPGTLLRHVTTTAEVR